MFDVDQTLTLDLTYRDVSTARMYVQYDARGNRYETQAFNREGSGEVVTRSIPLPDARFANGQNNLADFRIAGTGGAAIVAASIRRSDGASLPVLPLDVPSGDGSFAYDEIEKTGSEAWRTVTVSLPNARFLDEENFKSDFRIGNNYDGSPEFVSHVQVDFGPYP